MRGAQRRQREFRQPLTEDIELDLHCRDDIQKVLQGIRVLHSDPNFRDPVFKLLDETLLPHADRHQGRPGMDLWSIHVPGIVKQANRMDFDSPHDQANNHWVLRLFLGTADLWDDRHCSHKALEQNINRLAPELLRKISHLSVTCGHAILGIPADEPLRGAGDSFVAPVDVAGRRTSACCGTPRGP